MTTKGVLGIAGASSLERKKKYQHPEFDDNVIEGFMRYFGFKTYGELKWFLASMRRDK
jgi:hypothetical protein